MKLSILTQTLEGETSDLLVGGLYAWKYLLDSFNHYTTQ